MQIKYKVEPPGRAHMTLCPWGKLLYTRPPIPVRVGGGGHNGCRTCPHMLKLNEEKQTVECSRENKWVYKE